MGPAPAVAATRLAVRAVLAAVDGPVLVACSGGPDSVALAAATAFEARRCGVPAGLVTVDHGLQAGSAAQAACVVELGRSLGLDPVEALAVDVGRAGGPEAAARDARYAALRAAAERVAHSASLARPETLTLPESLTFSETLTLPELSAPSDAGARLGADNSGRAGGRVRVLLGHTRDDQAETVLLGLGRGSGPRSIAGMQVSDGLWARPFLGVDRATTVAACEAQGLPTWQDPMNAEDRFVRVRLRREVLPLLEDVLHGGVAASLARTADLLRDDLDALDAWAARAYGAAMCGDQPVDSVDLRPHRLVDHRLGTLGLRLEGLSELPRAVRTRVLRRWASDCGAGPLTAEHTSVLDALVCDWHGQGPVRLPGGVAARNRSGTLGFTPTANARQE